MMKSFNNRVSSTNFKVESKYILKLKELVRNFRQKKAFYLDHSKFATYVDPEYLSIFKEELIDFSKAWIRLQQKNMSSEKNPGIEGHANARLLHSLDVAINSYISAKDQLLNEDLAFVGGLSHDIGHFGFAHEGEHILSNYLQSNGICELHHSSMARVMFELEDIHNKVLKRLEEIKGRPLNSYELKKYYSDYLTISDIAVCHNGESSLTEVKIDSNKTDKDIENEYVDTFVKNGLDRKTRNRSKEGTIVLFCDPISYVAKDFRDGVIKGVVNVNDPDYEKLFIQMGLTKSELDDWASQPGKKDKIVSRVTRFLRDNLSKNSKGIDGAKMDKSVANLMYDLRQLNYTKSVKPSLRKLNDLLPETTYSLIDTYSQLLVNPNYSKESLSDTQILYRDKFLRTISSYPDRIKNIYSNIVQKGIEENVRKEIEEVINRKIFYCY